jgi:hypothetical protein
MLSCRRAAELTSQALDRPLGLRERVALGLHTLLCRVCSRYRRQLDFLQTACERAEEHVGHDIELDEAARNRIREHLEQARGGPEEPCH